MTIARPTLAVGCAAATLLAIFPAEALAQRYAVARPAPRGAVVVRSYAPRYYYPYAYYPYAYGYPYFGFGVAFSYYGGWYGPYGPYYYPGYPYYGGYRGGSLRLQVTPRDAEVFIDGYYAGTVDEFDGTFQRLHVEPGDHEVELFHPDRRSVTQRMYLQPDKTFTVKLEMPPLAPGDPAPVRPTAAQSPAPQTRDPQDRRPRPQPGDPRTNSEFGAISLRVQPSDAEVLIDGQRWDAGTEGDRLVVELGPGVHHVEVRKDGFRTYRSDVTIRRGQTVTVNVGLAQD